MLVRVKLNNQIIECTGNYKQNLVEVLQSANIPISALCNKNGTCGKCRIKICEGKLEAIRENHTSISEMEWKQGYRLACKCYVVSDCLVEVVQVESNMNIVSSYRSDSKIEKSISGQKSNHNPGIYVAIDIGTTTVVVKAFDQKSNACIYEKASLNPQRLYGADVITRMEASNDGKLKVLQYEIQKMIVSSLLELVDRETENENLIINEVIIAANMTMIHLFLGASCETLGSYPFHSDFLKTTQLDFRKVFSETIKEMGIIERSDFVKTTDQSIITIIPAISVFVGGDIVSGLAYLQMIQRAEKSILIDLGTNGEMAIRNGEQYIVTSTAAGPAFEGGNMTSGVGSINGAIEGVTVLKIPVGSNTHRIILKTIAEKEPVGICGTGIIEAIYELRKLHIITKNGEFSNKNQTEFTFYDSNHTKIAITQKDIREFQVAKAAILSGIYALERKINMDIKDIDKIYLAGGFGYSLSLHKAAKIGLFPISWLGKIEVVGNTSLAGAVSYGMGKITMDQICEVVNHAKEIPLANTDEFQQDFIAAMEFREYESL